jgi:mono/diheme cytochrome c family protein
LKRLSFLGQVLVGIVLTWTIGFSLSQTYAQNPMDTPNGDSQEEKVQLIKIPVTGYSPKPESQLSKEGAMAFKSLNCAACHSIRGAGGCLGPMLDGIGGKRSREYLSARITNTTEAQEKFAKLVDSSGELMPHVRISLPRADEIVAYLETLPEPEGGFVVTPHTTRFRAGDGSANLSFVPKKKSPASEKGARLYSESGCAACHSIGDVGGWIGPKLDGIAGRRDHEYIVAHITDAGVHSMKQGKGAPVSEMPTFNLTNQEIEKVASFLETLPNRANAPKP